MDLKEAARRLNISEITARRWIKSGRLQARIIEGPYGPQYEIDEEAIEEARNSNKAPVIINDTALSAETLIKRIREAVKEEIKGEISEEIKKQIAYMEERLSSWQEERDIKLMQAIREIQQRQEEMNKPFWKRWKRWFK